MSSQPPSRYLLLNYMKMERHARVEIADRLLRPRQHDRLFARRLFRHDAGDRLLELVSLPDLASLAPLLGDPAWRETDDDLRPQLSADFRRQLLGLQEELAPAQQQPGLGLLLARAEVQPRLIDAHRAWQEQVLFPYLSGRAEVEGASFYRSTLSTEPGMLMLVGFSGPSAQFMENLHTPDYQALLEEQASRFLIGALQTSLWTRV